MILALLGFLAGVIDSIAGGGGLITLPTLTWAVGTGAAAVGTNKIVGTVGALTALLVYLRGRSLPWRKAVAFLAGIVLGSLGGSRLTPHLNREVFHGILLVALPLILLLILKKSAIIQTVSTHSLDTRKDPMRRSLILFATGFVTGVYDGGFGPGGGTFMLLGLLFANKLPLFEALIISKLANTLSAGTSWISYGISGYVHWTEGFTVAVGTFFGAFLGSSLASQRAERIVRPMLVIVVLIFMTKLALEHFF